MENTLVLPCLRGVLGDWVFYSTLMTSKQIAKWVKSVKNIREATSLDDILQRDLKDRKKAIAKYLLTDKNRFFNSIIVGVFGEVPNWFEFDLSNANTVIPANLAESIKQSIGIMVFNGNEQMFAIDGQHRVSGIEIADNDDKNNILSEDQFSVLLVAHVDDKLGMKRTRKLFSDINKNAKPVSGGDKIKIDEEDLCSIVTRRIYADYEFFNGGKLISLTENAKLENNDNTHFTNLLGLYTTNKVLKKIFTKVPKTQEWDEENVIAFYSIAKDFYDYVIINLINYKSYFIDKTLTIENARVNNSYLLFRPIGLKLLAGLYVHYFPKENGLELLKNKINNIIFVLPNSHLNKIIWNNGKMEARDEYQKFALELTIYILGDLPVQREATLLIKYREILKDSTINLPNKI